MHSTSELLAALSKEGITITLVGDKLKAEPRKLVTEEAKEIVAQHKAEIIEALSIRQRDHGDPGRTWALGICPLCGNRLDQDGVGGCWHRAFHIGAEKSAGAPPCDDKPTPAPPTCENQVGPSCGPKMGMKISPVAVKWLRKNRVQLRRDGWSMAELYRRNRGKGIAWVGLWDQSGLSVAIESGGVISFNFLSATGQRIRQTAYPRKHQQKRSISHELRCKRMQIHRQG